MNIFGNIAAMADAMKIQVNKDYDSGQTGVNPMPEASRPQQPTAPVQQTASAPAMPTDTQPGKPQIIKTAADSEAAKAQQRSILNPMNGVNINPQVNKVETPLERLSEEDFYQRQQRGELDKTSEADYWKVQYRKNPDNAYALLKAQWASDETPEQQRKRERREALGETFRNLGNLIGNAANLYYTSKGGQYIDLNTANEKHRERMQVLKDKQEAIQRQREQILTNAKLDDLRREREQEAVKKQNEWKSAEGAKEREWKMKHDVYMQELDNAHKMGQIDAQTNADLVKQAAKANSEKELESNKQTNRIALKNTPLYGQGKAVTSVRGSDGSILTRSSKLTNEEAIQIVLSRPDYMSIIGSYKDDKGKVDWYAAAADVLSSGNMATEELEQMGFKKGVSTTTNNDNTPPSRKKGQGNKDNVPPSRRK